MPEPTFFARPLLGMWMLCWALAAQAAAATPVAAAIDRYLTERYPADKPGVAVIVVKQGKVVFRKGYGMADLEMGLPLRPDMVFRLASVSKQFTAAAILLLEQEGKLKVGDDIRRFFPDYPNPAQAITIEQVLQHVAGIPGFSDGYLGKGKIREDLTPAEIYEMIKSQPLEFEPGSKWAYSDGGYELLGMIIEKASGMRYGDFIEQRIFKPLGMSESYHDMASRIIPKRVKGYKPVPGGYANADYISMTIPYAAGALASTVDNLAVWDAAVFDSDKLLNADARRRMVTSYTLPNGAKGMLDYGYGVGLQQRRGTPRVFHTGQINGFTTAVLRLPKERIYVALLGNDEAPRLLTELVTERVAAIAAGKPYPEAATVKLAPAVLDTLAGAYRVDPKVAYEVSRDGVRLFMQRTGRPKVELLPVADATFVIKDSFTEVSFGKGDDGKMNTMTMTQAYGPPRVARRE